MKQLSSYIYRYIIISSILIILPFGVTAQEDQGITEISSPAVKKDTTSYTDNPVQKIRPARPDNFWRRVSLGGWVSFQFGNITMISVSPEAMLRTVDQLYLGLGVTYQYTYFKDWYLDAQTMGYEDFSSNVYGGRVYLRYYLSNLFDNFLGNIFAHAEYEYLAYTNPFTMSPQGTFIDPYGNRYLRANDVMHINSVFVGGGFKQPISNRAYFDLLLLFNLNDTPYSPYQNPILRLGVGVGL